MVTGPACLPLTGEDTTPLHELATRCARRYRIPGMTSDDVEQEAALALLQALPSHDPGRHGPAGGYLRNKITARLSRLCEQAKRRVERLESLTGAEEGGDAECGELAELARRRLSPRAARVIEMTSEGFDDAEIAANLGTSVGAVQQARSRAVAELREIVRV